MEPTRGQDPNEGQDGLWAPRPGPAQDRFSAWDDAPPEPSSASWPPPPPPPPPPAQPAYQPYVQYGPNQYAPYQQAPAPGTSYQAPPSNYLVFGILTTIFCFMPFGIVSIVKATSVNTLWSQGRAAEAFRASQQAKNWAVAALVALPVLFGGFMLLAVIGALAT